MEKIQDMLINILNELRDTIDIISQVNPKRQSELEVHIIRYYKSVNELSNILNSKIDKMQDDMEFQVNSTVERMLFENMQSFELENELDPGNKDKQNCSDIIVD
ncbi:Small nuclear ribonucleoprotein [Cryptosporidium felis]|nr:Small nuclear ribonucleoprotein [Cryptosporidium felis]